MSPVDWSRQTTPEQAAIFEDFAQAAPALAVQARAGSGKSTSMVRGVYAHSGARRPLFAAFMTATRDDLREKIRAEGGRDEPRTLNSLGWEICRRRLPLAVVDEKRGFRLAKQALGNAVRAQHAPWHVIRVTETLAAAGKMALATTQHELAVIAMERGLVDRECEEADFRIPQVAIAALEAMGMAREPEAESLGFPVGFDDQIYLPVVNGWHSGAATADLMVVDEAQDLTPAQLALVLGLAQGIRCAFVGDDQQAIFSWNGAAGDAITQASRALGAVERKLTVSFRCPTSVIELAQALVPDIVARPGAPEGLVEGVPRQRLAELATPGSFVLSRTNLGAVSACLELQEKGIVARLGGKEAVERILRIVNRKGRETNTVTELLGYIDKWERWEWKRAGEWAKGASERIRRIAERRAKQVADLAAAMRLICRGCDTIDAVKARIDVLFAVKVGEPAVICATVHQAKGQEADRVLLMEGTFEYPTDPEERHIVYVAITRSKKELYMLKDGD